jgi:hypothetical protein
MTIKPSGSVGIGTTSPGMKLTINDTTTAQIQLGYNDSIYGRIGRNSSGNYEFSSYENGGNLLFGTTGTTGSTTERVRIDSSGRLLVGRSSSDGTFNSAIQIAGNNVAGTQLISRFDNSTGGPVLYFAKSRSATVGTNTIAQNGDEVGVIGFYAADGANYVPAANILVAVDGTPGTNDMPGRLTFSTTADGASASTERMRIGADGLIRAYGLGNSIIAASAQAAGTTFATFICRHSASSTITGTTSFQVMTNGNAQNTNNSYGAISDIKLKENIVDANSQWSDIKALQVRNYNFKEGQTHTQIGLVAQEVELVSPGLVTESPDRDEDGNDLGTVTKSVNYSVLYMKAVKALQEAMERIETLEGMVAVNNITIDEQQHQLSTLAARLTALESA